MPKDKLSKLIPPVGDFIRMPAGSTVYYPVHSPATAAIGVLSYASRVEGKVHTSSMIVIDPKTLETQQVLRCVVVTPGKDRKPRGRPVKSPSIG